MRPHLGDQEDLFTAAGDSLADEYLRIPVRIHLGGVDQVHADVQTAAQRGNLRAAASPALAEAPGALAEHRDLVPDGSEMVRVGLARNPPPRRQWVEHLTSGCPLTGAPAAPPRSSSSSSGGPAHPQAG